MTTLLQAKRLIAAKIESTEGVAESLASADAKHLVMDDGLDFSTDISMHERNIVQASFSRHSKLAGVELARITCTVELRGSGVAATAPSWDTLLRPCGFGLTVVEKLTHAGITGTFTHGEAITSSGTGVGRVVAPATSAEDVYVVVTAGTFGDTETVTGGSSGATAVLNAAGAASGNVYEPISAAIPSLTVAMFHDGVLKSIKGARGNVRFEGTVGQPGMLVFDFLGVYEPVTDAALLSGITYESTIPPVLKGATLTFDAFAPVCTEYSIDMQNSVNPRESMSSSQGAISSRITGRNPTGTFNPEMDLVANFDFYGRHLGETLHETVFGVGSVAGNRFKTVCPETQIDSVGNSDRNGISVVDLGVGFPGNTTNQDKELSLLVY